jgi:hypothetical protein
MKEAKQKRNKRLFAYPSLLECELSRFLLFLRLVALALPRLSLGFRMLCALDKVGFRQNGAVAGRRRTEIAHDGRHHYKIR